MADDTLKIKVEYEIDDSKLNQSLAKIQSNTGKALSGGSGGGGSTPQGAINTQLQQANKLQDKLKILEEAQARLTNQPGQERNLAKVNQALATQYSHYKNTATTSSDYIRNLEKEVELRTKARNLTNNADGGSNQFSAHSQRQMAMLQQVVGQAPGGNILNQFLSGASKAGAGEGGGILSKAGLAGGGMAAGAAVAAAGIALVVSKMGEMASRAQELAQSAGSATSSLGQLRSATERTKINQDSNAVSSGVSLGSIWQGITQLADSTVGGLFSDQAKKKKDTQEKIDAGLGGDDAETWRRIKEHGVDLNVDLARQKQGLDIQQFRQNRDFELDLKQFAIDTANTKFDLQKSAQRQEEDYSLAKKQFDENFQGQMAAKQFALQKEYAQQDYQLNVARQTQDYQINKARQAQDLKINLADKAYDFGVSRQRQGQDYGIQRSDAKFDFSKSLSRNQDEFNINKGRQGEDYSESLQKAVLGGANGMDLMWMSRDFRKEQSRQQADFERQKKLATEDYSISTGRSDRDFSIGQGRNLADFNLGNQRDIRGFNIAQGRQGEDFSKAMGRGAQDFSISNQRMDTARQMQIETMLYDRKYQGISLERDHNRNLQDASIALQRFTQATGMQQQRFANQGADISQDQALQNRDFAISSSRALRDYGYQQQDFAGSVRKSDPLGAYGQSLKDPTFADALGKNASATGQLPLGDQVKGALSGIDWGSLLGNALAIWRPAGVGDNGGSLTGQMDKPGGGADWGKSVNVNFYGGSTTFPSVGGVSQADLDRINRQYQQDMEKLQSNYADLIKQIVSG